MKEPRVIQCGQTEIIVYDNLISVRWPGAVLMFALEAQDILPDQRAVYDLAREVIALREGKNA